MPDAPWWERTPEGTPHLLAFVQVVRAGVAGESPQDQARYLAGVEYVADKLGAAQPLIWRGNNVMLLLRAETAHALVKTALSAAEAIRERAMVDLSMTVRIAVHAARAEWPPAWEALALRERLLCEQLALSTPAQGVVLTEDVYLALKDAERRRFAPLGVWGTDGLAAYVSPTSLATQSHPMFFEPFHDETSWRSFRQYVDSPEVRQLSSVELPHQKKQSPRLDLREAFIPPLARRLGLDVSSPEEPLTRLVREHRTLVVHGEPGSGKTTALRWLAVLAAGGRLVWSEHIGTAERLLPLLLPIKELVHLRSQWGGDCSVTDVMAVYFQGLGLGDKASLRRFLDQRLEAGDCLLLLDGLDEIASEERSSGLAWLETFCALHHRNRMIVSTRRTGDSGLALREGVDVELGEFQDEQIRQYVRAFEHESHRDATRFLNTLFAHPQLKELARSPLLLSALTSIHHEMGPGSTEALALTLVLDNPSEEQRPRQLKRSRARLMKWVARLGTL